MKKRERESLYRGKCCSLNEARKSLTLTQRCHLVVEWTRSRSSVALTSWPLPKMPWNYRTLRLVFHVSASMSLIQTHFWKLSWSTPTLSDRHHIFIFFLVLLRNYLIHHFLIGFFNQLFNDFPFSPRWRNQLLYLAYLCCNVEGGKLQTPKSFSSNISSHQEPVQAEPGDTQT